MDADNDQFLLCFDFDGTLVDPSRPGHLDPYLERALLAMERRGARLVINTGRSLFHAVDGINNLGLRDLPHHLIAWEREIYQPTKFRRWVDSGDWNKRSRKKHRKLFRNHRRVLGRIRQHVEATGTARWIEEPEEPAGIIASDEPQMETLVRTIEDELRSGDRATTLAYERNSIYLRFSHPEYNKGTALLELRRQLGIPADRTFAVGDNHNDLTMLDSDVAGMVACPGNTIPEVASAVSSRGGYVAKRHHGPGVAEAIGYFFA
jgi:hypothetical protein